jgi:hypothetical protein
MRNKKIIQLVGLLILLFFTVEYLEPSSVGVRIGGIPFSNQSSTQEKSTGGEKLGTITPHAMMWSPPILFNNIFSYSKFQNFSDPFVYQLLSKKIFRPPLLSV